MAISAGQRRCHGEGSPCRSGSGHPGGWCARNEDAVGHSYGGLGDPSRRGQPHGKARVADAERATGQSDCQAVDVRRVEGRLAVEVARVKAFAGEHRNDGAAS